MNTVPRTPLFFVRTSAFLVLALAVASGCGRREELPLQDEVDFSRVGDVFSSPAGPPPEIVPPSTVLATVQGRDITQGDLQRETTMLLMAQRNRIRPEDLAAAAQQLAGAAFQSLIRKSLLLDAIEAEKVSVEDAAIEERLASMKGQLPEGQDWDAMLAAQGMDEDQVREQITISLRVDKLVRERVAGTAPVVAEEIAEFYEANTNRFVQPELAGFSHILFKVTPEATEQEVEEVRVRAEKVRDIAGTQVDFGPLAARFSDDEATKDKDGYVGKVAEAQLRPPLKEAVFGAETGKVSLVRSPGGFHLVRVESHEPSRQLTLEEVSSTISNLIGRQRSQEKLQAYMESLQEDADIEILGQVPAPASPGPE